MFAADLGNFFTKAHTLFSKAKVRSSGSHGLEFCFWSFEIVSACPGATLLGNSAGSLQHSASEVSAHIPCEPGLGQGFRILHESFETQKDWPNYLSNA